MKRSMGHVDEIVEKQKILFDQNANWDTRNSERNL